MNAIPEPIWNTSPLPVVAGDAPDTAVGPTWDLVVVGAGIVGLSAALTARESGRTVCVVEAGEVGMGVSGQSTVKVSSGHGALAGDLAEMHGTEVGVAYQRANDQGFAALAELVTQLPEDVGWSPTEHVVHAHTPKGLTRLTRAVRVSEFAGSTVVKSDVPPWASGQAWVLGDSALVQPVSLARAMARHLKSLGVHLLTNAPVQRVQAGADGVTVHLASGAELAARDVLVATHAPIHDPDGHSLRARYLRHYAVALPVDGGSPGSTYGVDEGSMSTRPVGLPDGSPGAVVVGPKMRTGQIPGNDPWAELAAMARAGFGAGQPTYTWATHDMSTPDLLPYVGRTRREPHVLVATGFGGWGFTNAAAVAATLPAILDGGEEDFSSSSSSSSSTTSDASQVPWQARRIWPQGGVTDAVEDGAWVAGSLVGDTVRAACHRAANRLDPGQGEVVGGPLNPKAVSKSPDGTVQVVSARCTHLGCLVRWNNWEQSWDCPCHGSRFAPDGTVLHGPASQPLCQEAPSTDGT